MATETPLPAAEPQKLSRYRSVRRAQEQQQHPHQMPSPYAHQRPPPMPAVPDMHAQNQPPEASAPTSTIGRSMSRYHRRPRTANATTTSPGAPPLRSNTLPLQPPPPPLPQTGLPPPLRSNTLPQPPPLPHNALPPSSPVRSRALNTPQESPPGTNHAQPRPRTAKHRADASPPLPRDVRQQQQQQHDDPRVLLQKERERQRLMKERLEAEARAEREAKRVEMERLEKLRLEEEEAARLQTQHEAEEAEALQRQKEEQKAEKERGKRLRKAEAQQMVQQRAEEERRAKLEEKERKAQLNEKPRTPHSASSTSSPMSPSRHDGGFGIFKRRKDEGLSLEEGKESTRPRTARQTSSDERNFDTIRPGGGGAVLGIDAPTSAVNGGDRRVTVVYNKKRIQLPVTPTTTPLDLFKSADNVLTDTVNVRTAVLMEWFIKVDIKRPLRNYEYVRDVMNSWDADTQNDFIIVDSAIDGIDQDELLSYGVPDTRPEGMSCMIQYSSRPGKWAKRHLTLRPDGQLVMAKNEKAKDQENICTLTDYDIYTVTQQKLTKVKPPKKICFAVKSLQKSNIFADESQYVHFFCTNDRDIATAFWKALQSWRSWYLKYQKGEGLKKKAPAPELPTIAPSHKRGESVGSHYQLGAFTSLLDMGDFNKKLDEIEVHKPGEFPEDVPLSRLDTKAMHARKKSIRVKQAPPMAYNRNGLAALATNATPQDGNRQNSMTQSFSSQEEEAFAPGGLLGRTYTTRQRAVQEREQKAAAAFTDGPSLVSNMDRLAVASGNDSGLSRKTSTRSNHHRRTSSDLQRSASKRIPGMPQPLIDLTPQYRPPPQHANKGKGFNPGMGAGPLVESATSLEEAIQVPSSTDWRARARPAHGTGVNDRTKSLKGRGEPLAAYTVNNHSGAPADASNAFTGGGLLSQAGYAQGTATMGRGVMDGSKAKGPMLDFAGENQFASGSLLASMGGPSAPIIDRSGK